MQLCERNNKIHFYPLLLSQDPVHFLLHNNQTMMIFASEPFFTHRLIQLKK